MRPRLVKRCAKTGRWDMRSFFGRERHETCSSIQLCRKTSEIEATTGWTEGKPWEIAWGELRWEEAI